ncbi:MAG: response regulator transcription factor [Oscillospiraceae bacterium]
MNNKDSILIVEDDESISSFIQNMLESNKYHTVTATTAKEAMLLLASHCPDAVLLDLGLPDMDGMEVLKKIRDISNVPVIIVSARASESEKVKALDCGADDYIQKPFGTSELVARIRTALRHGHSQIDQEDLGFYSNSELRVDFTKRIVTINDVYVHLTKVEYKIVALLAQRAGRVLTYDTIITDVWGPYAVRDNRILRVNMANIRRKIEQNPAEPKYILTEVGIGYRMLDEEMINENYAVR